MAISPRLAINTRLNKIVPLNLGASMFALMSERRYTRDSIYAPGAWHCLGHSAACNWQLGWFFRYRRRNTILRFSVKVLCIVTLAQLARWLAEGTVDHSP